MSYSQYGEDDIIAKIFSDYRGTLLEIGAWGVKDFSNSRLFIERGWSAVLVEFSPMPVHSLVKEYGHNDCVKIIQAAITADDQPLIEFDVTENALSTADQNLKRRWADASVDYYGKLWVPALSVKKLLNQFFYSRRLDYASIDTEGTSVNLALALLDTQFRPRVVVVEYDDGPGLVLIKKRFDQVGYRVVYENDTNVILELV